VLCTCIRLHFNAAMLEIHRRLHHQDVQRQQRSLRRRQQEEARANALGAAAAAAAADTTSSGSSSSSSSDATAAVSAAAAQDAHAADEHAEEEEEEEDQHESAADGRIVSAWFDDAVWQQKEAKAAVLAIRRHLRLVGWLVMGVGGGVGGAPVWARVCHTAEPQP
jgi:uncharacterized membrane protein